MGRGQRVAGDVLCGGEQDDADVRKFQLRFGIDLEHSLHGVCEEAAELADLTIAVAN